METAMKGQGWNAGTGMKRMKKKRREMKDEPQGVYSERIV